MSRRINGSARKSPRVLKKLAVQDGRDEYLSRLTEMITTLEGLDFRDLRNRFGLTQDALARLAELPVRTVVRWERGETPRLSSLNKLVTGLRKTRRHTKSTARQVSRRLS